MMELFTILLIPFALVVTFGKLVGDKRQSRLLLVVMAGILVVFAGFSMFAETNGNPKLTALSVDQSISTYQSGGNMEGKEVRIGSRGLRPLRPARRRARRTARSTACTTRSRRSAAWRRWRT